MNSRQQHESEPGFLDLFDVRKLGARSRSGLDLPIQLGFLLLVILLGMGAWLGYHHTRLLYENQAIVAHTQRVIAQVRFLQARLGDAESGARGYVITGSERMLEPYLEARQQIDGPLAELANLTRADAEQRALVELLTQHVAAAKQHLERTVEAGRSGNAQEAAALMRASEGRNLMESVRDVIRRVELNEEELLVEREVQARTSFRTAQATGAAVATAGLFLVVVVYNFVRRFDRLRSRATREIADARERFEVALSSIGDAVVVTDDVGRIVFCNEPCHSILGIRREDVGRRLDERISFAVPGGSPDQAAIVERAREEGGTHRLPPESILRRADGSELAVAASAASIHGGSGPTRGVILVVADASEREAHERALSRVNERFQSLVLATTQVVWTTDAEGRVREDSPAWRRLTGQTYEQWKGHGWLDAVHAGDRERVFTAWREAVREKRPLETEYRLHMADGSWRWTLARVVPVADPDGSIREWVGMNHDIQARKEAEEAQLDSNRRKDEFLALLGHELRNPLAPLRNGLEILKSGSQRDAGHAIELMDRQVRHMVRLIDDLLDVSRISQGKLELRIERVDLREVLAQAVDAVKPAIDAKRQQLEVKLARSALWVDGDPVRLTQIVTNLLNNAVKYSGEQASIWLSAEREGTRHLVSVRDTGQGIPTEIRPRIWDLFLQGGGRVERLEGGLGIGLTLVKHLVELHGGTVDVQSDGPGTGSEFSVRLPAVARPPSLPPAPAPAPGATRALRILVIDDNEDAAESLCMLLRVSGHSVRSALRGDAGLVEYARFEPELVLCDIRMPDMSGYEVARRLRALNQGRGALLVALTGFGTDSDRESSGRAGFDRHLVKPVDPEQLTQLVRDAAERTVSDGDALGATH